MRKGLEDSLRVGLTGIPTHRVAKREDLFFDHEDPRKLIKHSEACYFVGRRNQSTLMMRISFFGLSVKTVISDL